MDNQKKIEELLISIHKLILEAKNEEEFDLINHSNFNIRNEKINKFKEQLSFNKNNLDILKENTVPKINVIADSSKQTSDNSNKTKPLIAAKNLENNWKEINFSKCQLKKEKSELILNDFEKLFEDCLNEWIENNLSRIVKRESDTFAKKMVANKLK